MTTISHPLPTTPLLTTTFSFLLLSFLASLTLFNTGVVAKCGHVQPGTGPATMLWCRMPEHVRRRRRRRCRGSAPCSCAKRHTRAPRWALFHPPNRDGSPSRTRPRPGHDAPQLAPLLPPSTCSPRRQPRPSIPSCKHGVLAHNRQSSHG
jgi:hypothetical protein